MIKKITKIIKPLYREIFLGEGEYLKKELSDCNSVLDLGCGSNSLQFKIVMFLSPSV